MKVGWKADQHQVGRRRCPVNCRWNVHLTQMPVESGACGFNSAAAQDIGGRWILVATRLFLAIMLSLSGVLHFFAAAQQASGLALRRCWRMTVELWCDRT